MTADEARALLDTCGLHALLGLELVGFGDGAVSFRFIPPTSARIQGGGVHGGALATALDTAATFAVISSAGHDATTVDLRLDYLRPAIDAEFTVVGVALRAGRRFGSGEATVKTLEGQSVALARGTFTW